MRDAQELRQLPPGLEPRRIAFAVDATLIGADLNYLVFGDASYLELGRDEVRRLLLAVAPADAGPMALSGS